MGFSICTAFRHVVADGRAFHNFMKFWASVWRTKGEESEGSLLFPIHNRDIVIEDPKGIMLNFLEKLWNYSSKTMESINNVLPGDDDKVRSTIVLSRDDVDKIKKCISFKCKSYGLEPESLHISTFVVTCSLMWVCKVQSQSQSQDTNDNVVTNNDEEEIYRLFYVADCRNRQELSIPATYFGNCIDWRVVELKKSKLMGENGIVDAAIAIGSNVMEFQCEPLKGVENMMPEDKDPVKQGK